MKSSQDIQKEIDYVLNFAEQMGVPDDVYFQFIAVADNYLRNGDYERAEQQVGQALLAAQSYGLKPEGTMRITKSQLRRIIREEKARILSEAFFTEANRGSLDHLIQCYLDSDISDEECADGLPNDVNIEGLQDFANYVMRVVNIYRQLGNF